jgi:hypothetical protein
MEAVMKKHVIAGAVILGLGAVTIALAQPGSGPAAPKPVSPSEPPPRSSDNPQPDRSELHAKVAQLRAEVELLQLQHDLAKERLSIGLKEQADGFGGIPSRQETREYMRIGAEVVGKGAEFEAAMQEKGDEIWQAVKKAAVATAPADLDRLKQDFLGAATELNRKKIELVELEVHLDGSM